VADGPDQIEPFTHLLERFKAPILRPDQVAQATGWSRRTIYELAEEGLLEVHALPGRAVERKMITRRSVALFLLRSAKTPSRVFPALLEAVLPTLSAEELAHLIEKALAQRARAA
jgi:predicted DNA-binding transcriptional regulator AlpA